MEILLVDPNQKDARKIKEIISNKNWAVDICENGLQALNKIRYINYDAILTELYLPIIDGMSLCTLVKEQKPNSKVLIVTSETYYGKKTQAFHAGADEYMLKPVTKQIFYEKMERLFGESVKIAKPLKRLKTADLVMNLSTKEVYRFGEKISLRRKEFNLLMFMMMQEGKVLNRHTILENVWRDTVVSAVPNLVDIYVNSLRKKIDMKYTKKLIHTIYGVGYKLCEARE